MNRKFVLVLTLSLLITGMVKLLVVKTFAADYTDVTVTEAKTMIDQKPSLVILDVRNQSEYDLGHIRNARLIPVWQLATRLDELNVNDEILVYCGVGARSAQASLTLADNGFHHVYNMLNGMTAWVAAGYPAYVKYSSIQEAINNAAEGGSVNVAFGYYYERLTINKSLTLSGENKYTTIIDGKVGGTVISVQADNVTITGVTVQNSGCGCADYGGIYVFFPHHDVNITDNRIYNDGYGIKLISVQNVTIDHNYIMYCAFGIEIQSSSNSTITENSIMNNTYGIELNPSFNSLIVGNTIMYNEVHAIMLRSASAGNTVSENKISGSQLGIRLYSSLNNTFSGNTLANNTIGIDIQNSTGNKMYQNSFTSNAQHVQFLESNLSNTWDDGNLTGGNHWSNYTGADSNRDGIGDSPQVLNPNNRDNYPLMGAFSRFGNVDIVSDSTIEDFGYLESNNTVQSLLLRVSNATRDQDEGFCRITIPHDVLPPPYTVTVNGDPANYTTVYENNTVSIIYLNYQHSTLEIVIVPEFPSLFILALLGTATLAASMIFRARKVRSSQFKEKIG